jgi:hypothetical protein
MHTLGSKNKTCEIFQDFMAVSETTFNSGIRAMHATAAVYTVTENNMVIKLFKRCSEGILYFDENRLS